jgi:hypothetical protein
MSEPEHAGRSVLIAGAVIGLAILVGAERIRGAIVNAPHATVSAETSQRVAGPVPANPLGPSAVTPKPIASPPDELNPAASDDMKLRLRDQAQAQLALHQPRYAAACGPLARHDPLEPAFSNYRVTVFVDASGRELSRKFHTGMPHKARDLCVSTLQHPAIAVDAPGAPLSLNLSLPVP